jgi:hypothetical protein
MNDILQNDPEAALTQALEHSPTPAIPADFAARVVAALPEPQAARFAASRRRLRSVGVSRGIAIAAAPVLTLALFVIAPHATPSFASFAFDLEMLLLVQLMAVAWFLTPLRKL